MNDLRGNRSLTAVPPLADTNSDDPAERIRAKQQRTARRNARMGQKPLEAAPPLDPPAPKRPAKERAVPPAAAAPESDAAALSSPVSRRLQSMSLGARDQSGEASVDLDDESTADLSRPRTPGQGRAKASINQNAPTSRPSRRRELEPEPDPEPVVEDKFPWHHQFKDNEPPKELQANSPLLSRAFRYSVG